MSKQLPFCTLKESEDAFFAFFMVHTMILVLGMKCLNCLLNWRNGGFILLWTPPCLGLVKLLRLPMQARAACPAAAAFPNSDGSPVLEWGLHKGLVLPGEESSGWKHSFIAGSLAALRTQKSDSEISKCVILIKKTIKTSPISEVKRNSAPYSDLECKYFHVWIFF